MIYLSVEARCASCDVLYEDTTDDSGDDLLAIMEKKGWEVNRQEMTAVCPDC